PTVAAPTPTQSAAEVISVFSDAYTDVDRNLNPNWGQGTVVSEVSIEGNNTLLYSGLNFQGLELAAALDVTGMDFLHIDYWTGNSSALNAFLISTGPTETPYALDVPTTGWASVDIPLSSFDPVDLADVIQFKFDGNGDIYLDNIYFYSGGGAPTEPTVAAPTPTQGAADVVSVFSDAYTDIDRNLNPNWGQATVVSEVSVEGNNTLLYTGLDYQGLELGSAQDVSGMEFLHIDFWSANSNALSTFLISTGPIETPFSLNVPTSGWGSVDIPLSAFDPVNLADVIQLKFEGNGDIYLDNIYFYRNPMGGGDEPTMAAPTPTAGAGSVISMFSNAYTNVGVDTWRTDWSSAVLDDIQIAGNDTKRYTDLDFVGVETTGGNLIDASSMTHFNVDIWTPNLTTFRIKLVDFGPDGAFGGGDDSEHELIFDNLAQGGWVTYSIPLADFTSLTGTSNMAQLIFSGLPAGGGTLFVDNVYYSQQ
ncbi:MAG: hypothetical protein HRU12_02545, partial [Phaeodactylibacter sp.]|nr:hypothetical protein [Phaeodactylibacter sp.]